MPGYAALQRVTLALRFGRASASRSRRFGVHLFKRKDVIHGSITLMLRLREGKVQRIDQEKRGKLIRIDNLLTIQEIEIALKMTNEAEIFPYSIDVRHTGMSFSLWP